MASAAKVIRKEQPDILLLQEVKSYRIKTLVDELRDLYSDTKLKLIHDPEILQAVISRYPLKPLEASPQKGRSQKVLVETPYGRIIVINIHTYIWGWIRRHQQMTRLIKEDVTLTNDPIILGGDFNTSDQSQTYRLVNQYLKNAHWEAGCGFGFTYPSSSFRFKRKFSIPALIRIDHIFYSAHFIPRSARTLNESGGSDHLPVVAEFVLI